MKSLFTISVILLFASQLLSQNISINRLFDQKFKDPRDGKEYKTVKLKDGSIWMAENLAYKSRNSKTITLYNGKVKKPFFYFFTKKGESIHLYYPAENLRSACPDGWHAANAEDWNSAINSYSRNVTGVQKLFEAYKAFSRGGDSKLNIELLGYIDPDWNKNEPLHDGRFTLYWAFPLFAYLREADKPFLFPPKIKDRRTKQMTYKGHVSIITLTEGVLDQPNYYCPCRCVLDRK